jgi:iron complex transport system substrate-binding protein
LKKPFLTGVLVITFMMCFLFTLHAGTAIDSLGNRISIPDEGARIISLSPGATEVLFALGLDQELVGVSDFCNYPPEGTAGKPKMGGFSTPNIEKIQAQGPHVIVLTKSMPVGVKHQFERLGIQLFVAESSSFEELLRMIVALGALIGREDEAKSLAHSMKIEAGGIVEAVRSRSTRPVKTMIEIWKDPYYVAGKNTLPGDVVRMAGGRVVPESSKEYPILSEEAILEINPEALLIGHSIDTGDIMESHRNLASISAIRNNKIFVPDPDTFLRPGPRVVSALQEIARFLHPEAF